MPDDIITPAGATARREGNARQPDKRAEAILATFDRLAASRFNWETNWREIAKVVLPRYTNEFTISGTGSKNMPKGQRLTEYMFDMTGAKGLETFGAVMDAMLTPRSQKWHSLRASNRDLMKNIRVQRYFDDLTNILFRYRYAYRANYASQNFENWIGLGAFGNAGMYIESPREKGERGLRYRSEHLGNLFVQTNYVGQVDTFYRRLFLTARQAAQMFGEDVLGPQVLKELRKGDNKKDPTTEFEFIHCVRPRGDMDTPGLGEQDMPYASVYVSREDQIVVKTGGYYTFPLPFTRYTTAPHETYGRSPAMLAYGPLMSLNEQRKTALKAGHRAVDPVILAHDDGVIDAFDITPGTVNFGGVNPQGQRLVQTLETGSAGYAPFKDVMEMDRQDVNDVFMVTLFQILTENPQMTATEVLQRAQEKGVLLGPTMGRQHTEYLGPKIERELDVLSRQGILPPPPAELLEADGEYEIEYDSPISRTMRAEEASGTLRYMEVAAQYAAATGDQSMFDYLDPDAMAPDLQWIMSVPAKYQATPEQIAEKRQERQERFLAQSAIEAAPAVAGIAKAAGANGEPPA